MKAREWPPTPKKKKGETPYTVLDTWTFSKQKDHKLAMKKIVESSDLNTGKGHDRASEAITAYKSLKKEEVIAPEGKVRRVRKKPLVTPEVISNLPRPELPLTEELPPYPDEAAKGHMEELVHLEAISEAQREERELEEAQAKGMVEELSAFEEDAQRRRQEKEELTPEEERLQAVGQAEEMRDFEIADKRRFIAERKRENEQQWAEQVVSELSRMEEDSVSNQEVTPAVLEQAQINEEVPITESTVVPAVVVSGIESSSSHASEGGSVESHTASAETSSYWQKESGHAKGAHPAKGHGGGHHGEHGHGKKSLGAMLLAAPGFLLKLVFGLPWAFSAMVLTGAWNTALYIGDALAKAMGGGGGGGGAKPKKAAPAHDHH